MKLLYTGKTKDVYELNDEEVLLAFKDDATGKDGVFDPGENQVGLSIEGLGRENIRVSSRLFELVIDAGVPTHYVASDLDKGTMTVRRAEAFGDGVEVIIRRRAVGSFIRRYGKYAKEGQSLDNLVEFTLKDDDRNDPLINEDALVALNIMSREEIKQVKEIAVQVTQLLADFFEGYQLELYDLKLEFGRDCTTNELLLIDELSAGNMRLYRGDQVINPMDLPSFD